MALILGPAEKLVSADKARWLIYGDNGVGKSTLLATVEGKGLVVSAQGENIKPYRGHPNITVAQVSAWDDIVGLYTQLQKRGSTPGFDWIGFDTLTRLLGFGLEKVTGVVRTPEQMLAYFKNPPKSARGYDAWNDVGFLGREMVDLYQQLPLHVIWLCQEETVQPKFENDILRTIPLLAGNVAWKGVKDILEICGRLYVEGSEYADGVGNARDIDPHFEEVRRLLIGKHPRYFTKGPTHVLGYTVEAPTWKNLAPSIGAEAFSANGEG